LRERQTQKERETEREKERETERHAFQSVFAIKEIAGTLPPAHDSTGDWGVIEVDTMHVFS
jgi:hypothetical protein